MNLNVGDVVLYKKTIAVWTNDVILKDTFAIVVALTRFMTTVDVIVMLSDGRRVGSSYFNVDLKETFKVIR